MYHTHTYTADGEQLLTMPQYMYNGTYGSENTPKECAWYDIPCKLAEKDRKRQEAMIKPITITPPDKKLLYGMMAGMMLVFGVGAYLLLK